MSGWHPENRDGGILPNPDFPSNPAQAFPPVRPPLLTPPNYYGNGCDVRLRPHVINTLISENLALVDSVGMQYNPISLLNQRTAVEYVNQKGLPKYVVLASTGTPANYYTGTLAPPLLGGYNNGMVLTVIPNEKNQGWVRIDVGGGWWVPVLRNDHAELEAEDWPAWVPQLIGYFNGAFYMLGICKSQVPIVLKGWIGFWIRTDGNDTTGDGTENSPDKAFRTINGCWNAVGYRYSASPSSHIALMLGIPGDYESGSIGPYGAGVSLTGDERNRGLYRIHAAGNIGSTQCLGVNRINNFWVNGVTAVMDYPLQTAYGNFGFISNGSQFGWANCEIRLAATHPNNSVMLSIRVSSHMGEPSLSPHDFQSDYRFIGNGHGVGSGVEFGWNSLAEDVNGDFFTGNTWYFENIRFLGAGFSIHNNSLWGRHSRRIWQTGCSGSRYSIGDFSRLGLGGQIAPGSTAGSKSSFGILYP